ncbi:unnamed protein product [Prorocentrum cordatum]|uniref:JmjC domain-containing protein n=1 Tax=Prorocentrum cordatum TaxID=2364126 RepID=A0ABN9V4T9_9DINO|nr:unnamed protein product [Polarella glacialis]
MMRLRTSHSVGALLLLLAARGAPSAGSPASGTLARPRVEGSASGRPREPQAEFGRRLSTSGAQSLKLLAGDGVDNDRFGFSVAVSSDGARVVVGAYHYYYDFDDSQLIVHGSVYVLDGATGETLLKLVASDGAADNHFGESVAVSSDGARVVVGNDVSQGSVYVFNGATGERLLKLVASDGAAEDSFGHSVAVSSDGARVVVGSRYDNDQAIRAGSVYVLDGATGARLLKLVASDGAAEDSFGHSVAVSSDGARVVVGAYRDDNNFGSVYVFNGATGERLLKLVASDGRLAYDRFGSSVAVSSDGARVMVGSIWGYNGAGSVYVLDGATGETLLKLEASDAAEDDRFGISVAVSSDGARVVVGAYYDDDQGYNSGSAYVFDFTEATTTDTGTSVSSSCRARTLPAAANLRSFSIRLHDHDGQGSLAAQPRIFCSPCICRSITLLVPRAPHGGSAAEPAPCALGQARAPPRGTAPGPTPPPSGPGLLGGFSGMQRREDGLRAARGDGLVPHGLRGSSRLAAREAQAPRRSAMLAGRRCLRGPSRRRALSAEAAAKATAPPLSRLRLLAPALDREGQVKRLVRPEWGLPRWERDGLRHRPWPEPLAQVSGCPPRLPAHGGGGRLDPGRPAILEGAMDIEAWPCPEKWALDQLLQDSPGTGFAVGAATATDADPAGSGRGDVSEPAPSSHYSERDVPVTMTLRDYCEYAQRQRDDCPLYIFDDACLERERDWPPAAAYSRPACFDEDLMSVLESERPPHRWVLIGAARSGSAMHTDPLQTAAWNTLANPPTST